MKDLLKLIEESRFSLPISILLAFALRTLIQANNLVLLDIVYILSGTFCVFATYLFSLNLYHSRLIASLTSILMALSPNIIHLSINSIEASLTTTLVMISMTLLIIRQEALFLTIFYFAALFEKNILIFLPFIYFLFLRLEEKLSWQKIESRVYKFLLFYGLVLTARYMLDPFIPSPLFKDFVSVSSSTIIDGSLTILKPVTMSFWVILSIIAYYSMNNLLRFRSIPIWILLISSTWVIIINGSHMTERYLLETVLIILSGFTIGYKYRSKKTSQQLHHQA
jgi:hypothetical protein